MKKYIVRMLCSSLPWEPSEFTFVYVYAQSKEEAKQAVQDQMCYSITVNEVDGND
jgi:hypothetical protein